MNRNQIVFGILFLLSLTVVEVYRRSGGEAPSPSSEELIVPPEVKAIKVYEEKELRRIPLIDRGPKAELAIQIISEKRRCTMGDLEAIAYELQGSASKRLLMSLEPLDMTDTSFEPQVQSVEVMSLLNEMHYEFSFTRPKQPIQLGIFICKDDDRIGRCAAKPFIDINAIFAAHSRKDIGRVGDKIYFFQYLFYDINGAMTGVSDVVTAEAGLAKLRQYVSATFRDSPDRPIQDQISARAFDISKTLLSVALTDRGSRVGLVLPVMDKSCLSQ